ncbi:cysteine-rich repeat secretory-like protein [Rhynchospora pubera]|uniref:Cysteine-rich repeat secretory-like protein n=1 Tax=Rhynchospora pubera TaxID=906938 RepID=A0AAV8EGI5_9POAL|nr:cysteine-rich repeat secretory-like protein [Rhynchospora pubera]
MHHRMAPLLQIFILSLLVSLSYCADPITKSCNQSYTGSGIETNINHVLSDLVTKGSVGGFAVSSYGKGNSTIYGLAQCRGDVSSGDCSSCLADAAKALPVVCPKQTDARVWYDYCFMRYDTDYFIGQADTSSPVILYNVNNATDPDAFDKAVSKLMNKVNSEAVSAGNGLLGREKTKFTQYITIYALAQCTRDLQPLQCAQCLSSTLQYFPVYCSHRQGCRVLYTSCMVQYEIYPFYFPLDSKAKNPGAAKYATTIVHPH